LFTFGEKFYLDCIEKDKTLNVAYHGLIQIYRQKKTRFVTKFVVKFVFFFI